MGKKKKVILIPIIFVSIFFLSILSGCVDPDTFPIVTKKPDVSHEYQRVQLIGEIGVPFCKAKDHSFVYDTESHDNWEDYEFRKVDDNAPPDCRLFFNTIWFNEVQHKVTYYVRAVAYCYDFKKPYEDYEEKIYQASNEVTFYVDV